MVTLYELLPFDVIVSILSYLYEKEFLIFIRYYFNYKKGIGASIYRDLSHYHCLMIMERINNTKDIEKKLFKLFNKKNKARKTIMRRCSVCISDMKYKKPSTYWKSLCDKCDCLSLIKFLQTPYLIKSYQEKTSK